MNKDQVLFGPSWNLPSVFDGCNYFDYLPTMTPTIRIPRPKLDLQTLTSTPLIRYNRAMNAFCKQNRILINYQKLSSFRSHVNKTQNLLQKYLELAYAQVKSTRKYAPYPRVDSVCFERLNERKKPKVMNPWCKENRCEHFSSSLSSTSSIGFYSSSSSLTSSSLSSFTSPTNSSSLSSSASSSMCSSPIVNKKTFSTTQFIPSQQTIHIEQQLRKYEELVEHQAQLVDLLAQCKQETDLISASSISDDSSNKKRVRFVERAERRVEIRRDDDELMSEFVSHKHNLSRIDFSKSMIEIIIDSYRVFLQIDQVYSHLLSSSLSFFLLIQTFS